MRRASFQGGGLVIGVASALLLASPASGSVSHHHSNLSTQDVLDWIRYEAMPYNPMIDGLPLKLRKKILKLRFNGMTFIHPLSAFIIHDEAEFRASCHGDAAGGYSLYAVAQWGISYYKCSSGAPPGKVSISSTQFVTPMKREGQRIKASLGLRGAQTVTRIGGNRTSATVHYQCPSWPPTRAVRTITLVAAAHGSAATVESCSRSLSSRTEKRKTAR